MDGLSEALPSFVKNRSPRLFSAQHDPAERSPGWGKLFWLMMLDVVVAMPWSVDLGSVVLLSVPRFPQFPLRLFAQVPR
jgi:hypothetical protein